MPRILPLLLLLAALALPALPAAGQYPEPGVVNPSWQLDIEIGRPGAVALRTANGARWYYYLPYKVTNRSGENQLFIPEIDIANDQGDLITAGRGVPPQVFDLVKRETNNRLLVSPVEVVGQLLQGEDYAKQSVAIWPAWYPDKDVDAFKVFIGGLTGDSQQIENPLTGDPVFVRRTLMLDYETPGTGVTPDRETIELEGKREIMR